MVFVISHPTMKAQVRMKPGGRALDTSGMTETPPGSSYNGNGRGGRQQHTLAIVTVHRSLDELVDCV